MSEEKKEEKTYLTKEELLEILKEYDKKQQERFKQFAENVYKDLTAALNDLKNMYVQTQQIQQQNQQQNTNLQDQLSALLTLMRFMQPSDPLANLKDKIFMSWLRRKDIIERISDKLLKKSLENILSKEELKDLFNEEE
ncbi:MAG: hypothetical protein QW197_03490 [Candidatus Aenigmatarchaeota archaeon]